CLSGPAAPPRKRPAADPTDGERPWATSPWLSLPTSPWLCPRRSERRLVVLRFSCPQCGKAFKLPGETAGRPFVCPRCGERFVVPASAAAGGDKPERRSPSEQSRGLFSGMSRRVRWGLILAVGACAGSLVLAGDWALPLGLCSAVVFLAILYGHATGCPACGKFWARVR